MIRIVMLYCPCQNEEKIYLVYNITKTSMTYKEDTRCPREAIYKDLNKEVKRWLDHRECLIIMLDANEDIRSGGTVKWMKK